LIIGRVTYVLVFYLINVVMVSLDIVLYFHNRKLDQLRDSAITGGGQKSAARPGQGR
jgi:hypothetical protein